MHHHRRRKKRPNYGTRIVDVTRGINGFGFTISGQQPCILSSIVAHSPADSAGLRAGDFLIYVNGINASKLPHEAVVQLIGNSLGTIQMAIAENYYSDSSDDEIRINRNKNRHRSKYQHHKIKYNRNQHQEKVDNKTISVDGDVINLVNNNNNATNSRQDAQIEQTLIPPSIATTLTTITTTSSTATNSTAHNVIHSPNASNKKDIYNVSAMVCKSPKTMAEIHQAIATNNGCQILEYRVVVGYLGTIEMPKQIATSSKLQTVRSCIRKMRQEKRNPFLVLMTILPHCLTLKNTNDILVAKYPTSRLSYVSNNCENDNRFFGLVTTAIYADGQMCEFDDINQQQRNDIIISNSCHVFVIDLKLIDHGVHTEKANIFNIECTKDPISNLCLEFPSNSDYIVNLIRSMYTLKIVGRSESNYRPAAVRINNNNNRNDVIGQEDPSDGMVANSPQPSNHSEITTTSSNSDSGIGFHNDCTNISDRILVVDFPILQHPQIANIRGQLKGLVRPSGIVNEMSTTCSSNAVIRSVIAKTIDGANQESNEHDSIESRLGVRAITNKKTMSIDSPQSSHLPEYKKHVNNSVNQQKIVDLLNDLSTQHDKNNLNGKLAAKSYDDILIYQPDNMVNNNCTFMVDSKMKMSLENINQQESNPKLTMTNEHVFRLPIKPVKKTKLQRKSTDNRQQFLGKNVQEIDKIMSYKLSPKVFDVARPLSISMENLKATNTVQNSGKTNDQSLNEWGSLQELRNMPISLKHLNKFMDGICSEPDITARTLPNSSPFKRWGQTSFRSRTNNDAKYSPTIQRRPSSLAASDNDVYTKAFSHVGLSTERLDLSGNTHQDTIQGVEAWRTTFEKLLEDATGLHTFAEFLKKEFSAENIYFWAACERYRQMERGDREKEAIVIFSKHLGLGASEPVNVDSQARNMAQENLQSAAKDLFIQAQKQIFNLMKFDSYQRFIRSDLFKMCLEAEAKNQPLPYRGDQLDDLLKTWIGSTTSSISSTKLKKSLSNAEDRRRKSLLPWHRKVRCKSKDRGAEQLLTEQNNSLKVALANSISDIHSSRSSLSSFDAALSCRTVNHSDKDDGKGSLCRVILTDGATTIVQTRQEESIRELVERLLEKRGISYQAYEVFLSGNSKAIDLDGPSIQLAGKEVLVEQRVVFKLDLPNRKVISVKSKPSKALAEVLRPILHKYNYSLDLVQIYKRNSNEIINMALPITIADGQRLQVVCNVEESPGEKQPIVVNQQVLSKPQKMMTKVNSTSAIKQNVRPSIQQVKLDEITNKVFNQLLQGKVESHSHVSINTVGPQRDSDQGSIQSGDWSSETSSSILGRLKRRNSNLPMNRFHNNSSNVKFRLPSKSSTGGSEEGMDGVKKPLIAKLKAGVKLQVTGRSDNHDFLEGLKRAQCSRLEDQRGTEINFELPEFLKDKENYSLNNNNNNSNSKQNIFAKEPVPLARNHFEHSATISPLNRPQPAPRLSITKPLLYTDTRLHSTVDKSSTSTTRFSPCTTTDFEQTKGIQEDKYDDADDDDDDDGDDDDNNDDDNSINGGPPPLPPKPTKLPPIKPLNWKQSPPQTLRKGQIEMFRSVDILTTDESSKSAYLDQPNSSFV